MTATIEDLQAENAWLKERHAELVGETKRAALLATFGVTPKQGALLAALLANPDGISSDRLYIEVFEDPVTGEGPIPKIVAVTMHSLRVRLARKGAPGKIYAMNEFGYRISPDMRTWVDAQMAQFAERLAA